MNRALNTTALGDIVDLVMGQAPSSKDTNFKRRGTPFVKVGEFGPIRPVIREWTTNPLRMARRTDVLLCVVGATCGKINLGEECAIGRSVAAIRPHPSKLDQFYLYYFMMTLVERLRSSSVGAAQTVISKEMVETVQVPLPPLAEQRRIVAILDEAFEGIATAQANAEKNLQNARAIFESHLQAVFSQRGKGWVDRKLRSLCREITVGYVGPMAKEYTESGVTFLRSQNIRPFQVSLENALFISQEFDAKIAKSRLRPGDVAVVRTGYPGTAAVIPASLPESNCADLVIVRPGPEVEPQFLAAFFNSAYGQEHVAGKVVGAAQKHFNVGAAKETVLHLPPLQEQREVIAKFDALAAETQRLTRLYERKQAALAALKKSLLHRAFCGEL